MLAEFNLEIFEYIIENIQFELRSSVLDHAVSILSAVSKQYELIRG